MHNENWKIWDRRKDYGELLYNRAIGKLDEMESAKAVCEILRPIYNPGMSLADVGCGAGHYLRSLLARLDADIDYTGIDATEYYIELAQKAFPDQQNFIKGDIYKIPFDGSTFDIVMSNNLILHLPPPPLAPFRELIRISRKYVVIRTVFGKRNYIVKEIREQEELTSGAVEPQDRLEGEYFDNFNYFNMYTDDYVRYVLKSIDDDLQVDIFEDTSWQSFDNTQCETGTATKVVADMQVSGNLLLNWKFIVVSKP
jgi:ubiquinone/menaquinone biosynthesis C-methylase UbiE